MTLGSHSKIFFRIFRTVLEFSVNLTVQRQRKCHNSKMGSGCSSKRVHVSESNYGEPPASQAGSPWIFWEDEHGNPFYYNFRTGSYTAQEQECDWHQYYDDNENVYWYNSVTHESSWNGPCSPPELPMLVDAVQRLITDQINSLPVVRASNETGHENVPVAVAVPSSVSDNISL